MDTLTIGQVAAEAGVNKETIRYYQSLGLVAEPPRPPRSVRRYGRSDLADKAARRWLTLLERTYHATGSMKEKYDVVHLNKKAGGGEYPTQDGFGWTNGVALALCAQPALRETCKN